jgi:TRAP-type C4-dicarboxylate transport system permease small subunit
LRTVFPRERWLPELARILLVWVSLVGAALAFGEKAHLGVDFFVVKLHPQARKTLSMLVQLIFMALAVVVFIAGGWGLAMGQMGQQLPTLPWVSRGLVYLAIPLGGVFMLLFAIENLIEIAKTPADRLGAQTKSEG